MKYFISFNAEYEFEVEKEDKVVAAEEISRLLRLLASYGFMVDSIRCYFADKKEDE